MGPVRLTHPLRGGLERKSLGVAFQKFDHLVKSGREGNLPHVERTVHKYMQTGFHRGPACASHRLVRVKPKAVLANRSVSQKGP